MLNRIFLLLSITAFLFGQTQNIQLSWNKSPETDLYLYQIYKSQNPNASSQSGSVIHPDTVYIDSHVEKGVLYYYRLKAVDLSLNSSEFSDEISVAIPKISTLPSVQTLPPDTTVEINLDQIVQDPDNSTNELTWKITGNSVLEVTISNQKASITTPTNWNSQERLFFTVTDSDGLSDRISILYKAEGSVSTNSPVFFNIPDQQIIQDSDLEIDLSDYVSDNDSEINELLFEYIAVDSIDLQIEGVILTVSPFSDFLGSRNITVLVTDNTGLSDQTSFDVTVINPNNESNIFAYPMPYRKNEDATNQGITFVGLPVNGKLFIYNLNGDPVFKEDINQPQYQWDVKNKAGKEISSGLYIYIINDDNNKKVDSGKIVIVR